MFRPGQILSHLEMSQEEHVHLQKGMNYNLGHTYSVILMSLRPNAPYADRIEDNGRTLIYEGHDIPRSRTIRDPKLHDQPMRHRRGSLTENGKFFETAKRHHDHKEPPHLVRVYEKIHKGIWVYNGTFNLVDAWQETSQGRQVFKFRLNLSDTSTPSQTRNLQDVDHNRIIPSSVKREVWKRDGGKCSYPGCGKKDNLHFDHIIPYSKGGTSLKAENIQLLCIRHNLQKHDRIE